jgi:putative endonuclease
MDSKSLGSLGEKIASDFLTNKGYRILDKNYSPRWISGPRRGEIDIIAEKEGTVSFIEVKTLESNSSSGFNPEDKVNFQKQKKIMRTAENWLIERKIPLNSRWQIDVVAIKINSASKKAKIQHFQNAVF